MDASLSTIIPLFLISAGFAVSGAETRHPGLLLVTKPLTPARPFLVAEWPEERLQALISPDTTAAMHAGTEQQPSPDQ